MPTQAEQCSTSRAMRVPGTSLVMPSPWDADTFGGGATAVTSNEIESLLQKGSQ
jgi:hypothetical protein